MTKWILSIVAVLCLAGCGSEARSVLDTTTSSDRIQSGYYDMSALENALESGNMTAPNGSTANPDITNANCLLTGSQTATCQVQEATGIAGIITVSISVDGQSFIITGAQQTS